MDDLLDVDRLTRWMDATGVVANGEPVIATPIAGGASNEIFEIRRGDAHMVLRRPPRHVPAGRNETMLREFRVLSALEGTDVPHASAIAVCEDTDVIGACFTLTGYVDGWSPMELNAVWPAPFGDDLQARAGLAYELVDGIARLAGVDWRTRGLEGFGRPDGFHERQVERWLSHLAGFQFRDLPGIDGAAAWLRHRKPKRYEPGIIHGDYQFANVMFCHGAPAQLAAIIDWEMATIGDPLLDLAWVLMSWPNPDEDRTSMSYVDYGGMPTRRELADRYAAVSGRAVDDFDYYVILARFKMAIVLEGGYARYVKGDADNPKMEAFGGVVLDMAAGAAELVTTTTARTPSSWLS